MSNIRAYWIAALCGLASFCASISPTHAAGVDLLEFAGDINKVFTIAQEAPLAETDDATGNLTGKHLGQEQAESMSFEELLANGKRIYTTPFTLADGYGDGPTDPGEDYREEGGRAGLQKAYPVMRVNGLDAQACLECHIVMRSSTIPATPGIGGATGVANNVLFEPSYINMGDHSPASFDGRFINPVNNAGLGGIELLAKEMTADLQEHRDQAMRRPGESIRLTTHDVDFGILIYADGRFDYSGLQGVDEDLVVKPFGRKGEFGTVRDFDIEAMSLHFGMQATELYGMDTDADGDGVINEILAGDLSALHVFLTNLPRPLVDAAADGVKLARGLEVFQQTGCAGCHKPVLHTRSRYLTYSFPEEPTDPAARVYLTVDLAETAGFVSSDQGLAVSLFGDLKRHDMGEGLSESLDLPGLEHPDKFNREFRTANLWAVRDTAPYLHDGRAQSIPDAVLAHGGEAQGARDAFTGLSEDRREDLLYVLHSLRNPLIR